MNYLSTDLAFSLVGYLATISLQNDLAARLARLNLLDGRPFQLESQAAWSAVRERDFFDTAIRSQVEEGIAQNLRDRIFGGQSGEHLLKCFFLFLDASGTVRCWVPPERDLQERLGPPFTYPAVMNGIVLDGELKTPPLGQLRLPPESLAQSKGLGLAIARRDIVYRSDFGEARSHSEFDALAGFMSVLVIPVPVGHVPGINDYPFTIDVAGAVVITSPVPSYFGPPDESRGKNKLPRPRGQVLHEVLEAVRALGVAPIFALMREAIATKETEDELAVLDFVHEISQIKVWEPLQRAVEDVRQFIDGEGWFYGKTDDARQAVTLIRKSLAELRPHRFALQRVSLASVVNGVLNRESALMRELDSKGVFVETSDVEASVEVCYDPVWLARHLRELIANAVRVVEGREPEKKRIKIECRRIGDFGAVAVYDTGGQPSRTQRPGGLGIGLKLIELSIRRAIGGTVVGSFRPPARNDGPDADTYETVTRILLPSL